MLKKIKHHWWITEPAGQIRPPKEHTAIRNAPKVRLLGAPDDRGVLNVGGRLGAGHGPHAIRQMLSQFMLGLDGSLTRLELYEGFDIALGESIEAGHSALRHAVTANLKSDIAPIVLGGGHDYGFPHCAGASDLFGASKVALINVDPHLDVRPPGPNGITSGSPFYLALENKVLLPENFIEFGIQEHCNDEQFYNYVREKGAKTVLLDQARANRKGVTGSFEKLLQGLIRRKLKIVVSFDVDSVQMAHNPGVSAPQSDGLSASEFLKMAEICGKYPEVVTIGFFELAPPLDFQHQSTRLVATAIHRFLTELSRRPKKRKNPLFRRLQPSVK